jgi:hypothetical protein
MEEKCKICHEYDAQVDGICKVCWIEKGVDEYGNN